MDSLRDFNARENTESTQLLRNAEYDAKFLVMHGDNLLIQFGENAKKEALEAYFQAADLYLCNDQTEEAKKLYQRIRDIKSADEDILRKIIINELLFP